MSFNRTGFIVQGNTAAEAVVNTNDTWVCIKNGGYSTWETPVCGYYVAGPGELLDAASYPWGWEQSDYDDSGWVKARQELAGSMKGEQIIRDVFWFPLRYRQWIIKWSVSLKLEKRMELGYPENFHLKNRHLLFRQIAKFI